MWRWEETSRTHVTLQDDGLFLTNDPILRINFIAFFCNSFPHQRHRLLL
ncbi:unnamed protein product [Brassica oleracea]